MRAQGGPRWASPEAGSLDARRVSSQVGEERCEEKMEGLRGEEDVSPKRDEEGAIMGCEEGGEVGCERSVVIAEYGADRGDERRKVARHFEAEEGVDEHEVIWLRLRGEIMLDASGTTHSFSPTKP